jgi:hypothetical protein
VAEVIHHHTRISRESLGTPPGTRAVFRQLVFRVDGEVAEVAGGRSAVLRPADYAPSWAFGHQVVVEGLDGVAYPSVRAVGGACLAILQDQAIRLDRVEFGAVVLEWDGTKSARMA